MFAYEPPLNPPADDTPERVDRVIQEFYNQLHSGLFAGPFIKLYDMLYEEIEDNLNKFEPGPDHDLSY